MGGEGPRSPGGLVGPDLGDGSRLAGSEGLLEDAPSCREDMVSPEAVRACTDCGRRGEDCVGRAEGTRRGTCLNVDDLRDDDSDDSVGLGLGPGDVCGVEPEEDGPETGSDGGALLDCVSGIGIEGADDSVDADDGEDGSCSAADGDTALLDVSLWVNDRLGTLLAG